MTAAARALHREEPPPWVLDDYLALPLAGEEGAAIMHRLRQKMPTELLLVFSRWMCVRARVPEDVVDRAIADGTNQYVILGAGLDSFAYRRADLVDRLRVFEVDHPASQAWKRARLAELDVRLPKSLVFVPIDFERQTLHTSLRLAGFDFDTRAVISWIGVTMYLTLPAIEATLATVAACAAGSQIVLTYNLPRSALAGQARVIDSVMSRVVGEMGEPWISLFRPNEAEELLRRNGFNHVVHFGPTEAVRAYFAGRNDVRLDMPQRLILGATRGYP